MMTTRAMLDNFVIVKGDDSGNITLHLSDYAAWAIYRRLDLGRSIDDTEREFVNDVIRKLKNTLEE